MKKIKLIAMLAVLVGLAAFNYPIDRYAVDVNSSTLTWTGYHLAKSYEHTGKIKIKSGSIELDNGDLVGANIVIDMNAITNDDLIDKKDNSKLVNDLKSKRFFNAKEFPEAALKIKDVYRNDKSHYTVTADITIRGITKEINFGVVKEEDTETSISFTADIEIDRTLHKVMYGWSIENAILSNTFDLKVELTANRDVNLD